MLSKSEKLIDMIYKKLKKYKYKEIFLEKETLKEFINLLLTEK